ncbi:hypothetical protein evm_013103 [Chilo suppressalis]|nr:hypothetical protein evm_013103 [Chilo suppressalis]
MGRHERPSSLQHRRPNQLLQEVSRPHQDPYHWDSTLNADFSNTSSETWLPLADNYKTLNLANQIVDKKSHYHFYRDVANMKKSEAVRDGDLDTRALSDYILVATRLLPGTSVIVGIVNLSGNDDVVDLSSLKLLPSPLQVVASGVKCSLQKGTIVPKNNIKVSGHCALVLETVNKCC